jgi:hypothetical protein
MAHVSPELRYSALLLAALPPSRRRALLRMRPRAEQACLKRLISEVRALCGNDSVMIEALIQRWSGLSWPSSAQRSWAMQQDPMWLRLLVHQKHPAATFLLSEILPEGSIAPPIEGDLPAGLAEAVEALSSHDALRPPAGAEACV